MRSLRSGPVAAAVVAAVALALYRATLLPDLELGDSSSFQTMAGSPLITPRDGYPLYYAIAALFVPFFESDAHAMNVLSAVAGALACGAVVMVAVALTGSALAAAAGALFFAGSYTFWSQSIIAEVYALHMLLVASTLLLLLHWSLHPSFGRLCWFFAAYALAFGNHLSMILLAPAYTVFLSVTAPGGWRSLATPRVIGAASAFAALGLLQYAWNFSALWAFAEPPDGVVDALQTFWFDVTKSDWRDTMVLRVPASMAGERLRMYLFDLRQQFGWIPPLLALAGIVHLGRTAWRLAVLFGGVYVVALAFALGYNVGDAHVFFLPSHLMVALLAAPGIAAIEAAAGTVVGIRTANRAAGAIPALAAIALAGTRIYADFPALDRSGDTRPTSVLASLTEGLDDRNAILLTDLNWQVQNGLTYFAENVRPEVAYARLSEVLLYAPVLIRDNLAIGRHVVLTERARLQLHAAYGPLFPTGPYPGTPKPALGDVVRALPRGTRYVLCVLKPSRDFTLDTAAVHQAVRTLSGDPVAPMSDGDYFAMAGLVGDRPALIRASPTPFTDRTTLDGVTVDVRMESWLAFDTIRRMGFGHIIANRHHALIVERGLSFVSLDANGRAGEALYEAGIFAPQPRYRVLSSN